MTRPRRRKPDASAASKRDSPSPRRTPPPLSPSHGGARASREIEFRELEAFVRIAETGSFTRAASELLLTQPTISARIRALELSLGTAVFERSRRGVALSPAGSVFLPEARRLLRQRKRATASVDRFLGLESAEVDIAASSVPGSYLLPGVLAEFRRLHPGVRVRVRLGDTREARRLVVLGEAEFAVVGRKTVDPRLRQRIVAEDDVVLVCTAETARRFELGGRRRPTPARLAALPLVLREEGSATRAAGLDALSERGLDVDALSIVLELGANSAVLESVLADSGAAFLSRLVVRSHLARAELVEIPLRSAKLQRPLVLVSRRAATLSPAADTIVRMLEP